MSGRISVIAVHPEDKQTWYIGVASGGVWKTTNAGITFTPVFQNEGSYSIGTVVDRSEASQPPSGSAPAKPTISAASATATASIAATTPAARGGISG